MARNGSANRARSDSTSRAIIDKDEKQPRGPVPILSIVQTTPRSRETPTAIRLPKSSRRKPLTQAGLNRRLIGECVSYFDQ